MHLFRELLILNGVHIIVFYLYWANILYYIYQRLRCINLCMLFGSDLLLLWAVCADTKWVTVLKPAMNLLMIKNNILGFVILVFDGYNSSQIGVIYVYLSITIFIFCPSFFWFLI